MTSDAVFRAIQYSLGHGAKILSKEEWISLLDRVQTEIECHLLATTKE